MSESEKTPSMIIEDALSLVRQAEAKISKLKEHSDNLEIDPDVKSRLEKSRNEFLDQVFVYIDYWHDLPGKTIQERMEGLVFSILSMLDGEAGGMPPFAVKPLDEDGNEGEDIAGSLHDIFSQRRREGER